MNSAKRVRFRLYAIIALIGYAVMAVANVFVEKLSNFKAPTGCTSATCLEVTGISLLGFSIMIGAGWSIFRGLINAGYIQPKPSQPLVPGSGGEDGRILAIANELLAQLKLRRTRFVETLSWSHTLPWYSASFGRQGFRKPSGLVLCIQLRESLGLDEWRTLLNYYFVVNKPRLTIFSSFLWVILPFLLSAIVAVELNSLYGLQAGALFGSIVGPWVALWTFLRLSPWMRGVFLKADQWAGKTVGMDALLAVFKKIDSLGLPEVENSKRREGWIARLWPMCNITERIDSLQS